MCLERLCDTDQPVAAIAATLTYDEANFTKFIKRFGGCLPRQYRTQRAEHLETHLGYSP